MPYGALVAGLSRPACGSCWPSTEQEVARLARAAAGGARRQRAGDRGRDARAGPSDRVPARRCRALDRHRVAEPLQPRVPGASSASSPGREHPLVLFLDDLQWADPATLSLLPAARDRTRTCGDCCVIGAYRDNEVSPTHPLDAGGGSAARRRGAGHASCGCRRSAPITCARWSSMPSASEPSHDELSSVVLEKTGGNPFFVTQFLTALHQDGHLRMRPGGPCLAGGPARHPCAPDDGQRGGPDGGAASGVWVSRPGASSARRRALEAGSISAPWRRSPRRTVLAAAGDLWPAIEQGLVLPEDHSYGTASDLEQETGQPTLPLPARPGAAGGLRPDPRHGATQGAPRDRTAAAQARGEGEWLFDVVHHLNYGADLLTDVGERVDLARAQPRAPASAPRRRPRFPARTATLPPAPGCCRPTPGSGTMPSAFAL